MIYKIRLVIKEDPLAAYQDCDDLDACELAAWYEAYPDVLFENYFEEKKKKKAIRAANAFAKELAAMEGLTVEVDLKMVCPAWTSEKRAERNLNSYEFQEYKEIFNRICEHGKKFKNFSDNERMPW